MKIDGSISESAAHMLIRNRVHDFISVRRLTWNGKTSDHSHARPSWLSKKKSSVSFLILHIRASFRKNENGLEVDHLRILQGEIVELSHRDRRIIDDDVKAHVGATPVLSSLPPAIGRKFHYFSVRRM
jgi:hypothetical protein